MIFLKKRPLGVFSFDRCHSALYTANIVKREKEKRNEKKVRDKLKRNDDF